MWYCIFKTRSKSIGRTSDLQSANRETHTHNQTKKLTNMLVDIFISLPGPESASGVWMRNADEFRNMRKTFWCEDACVVMFSWRSEMWANLLKNAPSRNVEESLERFLDPDPQTEKFDNLTSFSPDRCLPVCELWSLVKSTVELWRVGREQTHTHKQTNRTDQYASRNLHFHHDLADGGNN